ncbi:hypothetical protein IMG5_158590 [Ichthyophthirius multifiliis]|uniref:CDC20/Fizzy WD40 domain-containing protein n=1 Tax=Ichthyophthirius multifiliis TaxID=5932 RepID=G0QZN5_ICHMU|nr:hypothetical protein IMG5_158590 [Ichthyophthirius multifiliis]EGR29309.1 hypothetical protein IMG5_158590 [Ichthyophthirius multifiliis]|eukprot:XP_004030545.1 hypothetical protein IMG5_158590 [Ichthyophthirius multifiliis]
MSIQKVDNKNLLNLTNDNDALLKKSQTNYLTDRFIPSRKFSKLNIYQAHEVKENKTQASQYQNNNNNNPVIIKNAVNKEEVNQTSIAQLYKNCILGIKDQKTSDSQAQIVKHLIPYKNQNILRFYKSNYNLQKKANQNYLLNLEEDMQSQFKNQRKIAKVPYKVLDAPALQDDFYLNLIDWSNSNILAVGLSSCVYLWSAQSSSVTKLCDFGRNNEVTSVNWSPSSPLISIGTNSGEVEIWDTQKQKMVRVISGHTQRVGALAQNQNTLISGSRDTTILQRDIRSQNNIEQKFLGHKQEVCGLKWSFDQQQLASGGNDNKLYIWNMQTYKPIVRFDNHNAAVKALAWSPHQHGLLVSGGGTQDKTIRFWNTLTSKQLQCIETGSQVCNLIFSKNTNEIVSTHGYSQNEIIIWGYPDMQKITTLTGHSCRVLYLAISPDGQTIVTGAGDETLRFWNICGKGKNEDEYQEYNQSQLMQQKNISIR